MYVCVCVCLCVREREGGEGGRERERERDITSVPATKGKLVEIIDACQLILKFTNMDLQWQPRHQHAYVVNVCNLTLYCLQA